MTVRERIVQQLVPAANLMTKEDGGYRLPFSQLDRRHLLVIGEKTLHFDRLQSGLATGLPEVRQDRAHSNLPTTPSSLQPIIPLVVCHGERAWLKNRMLSEIIPYPADLAEFSVQFQFPILDLWQTEIEKLPAPEDPFLQSRFYLLKYSRSSQLSDKLAEIFRLIAMTTDSDLANNHIYAAFI